MVDSAFWLCCKLNRIIFTKYVCWDFFFGKFYQRIFEKYQGKNFAFAIFKIIKEKIIFASLLLQAILKIHKIFSEHFSYNFERLPAMTFKVMKKASTTKLSKGNIVA